MIETQIEVDQNQDEASLNLQRKRLALKLRYEWLLEEGL